LPQLHRLLVMATAPWLAAHLAHHFALFVPGSPKLAPVPHAQNTVMAVLIGCASSCLSTHCLHQIGRRSFCGMYSAHEPQAHRGPRSCTTSKPAAQIKQYCKSAVSMGPNDASMPHSHRAVDSVMRRACNVRTNAATLDAWVCWPNRIPSATPAIPLVNTTDGAGSKFTPAARAHVGHIVVSPLTARRPMLPQLQRLLAVDTPP
jgi:hypothetical protein